MKRHNKNLAGMVKQAGVVELLDYATLMDPGLSGGLRMRDYQARKRPKSKQKVLDNMASTERAVNLFRPERGGEIAPGKCA